MILTIISIIFTLLTLIGFSRKIWWFTIFDFFRLQYVAIQLILFIIALVTINIPSLLLNSISIALNLYRIKNFLPKYVKKSTTTKRDILCINVFKDNEKFDRLRKVLRHYDPEVLLIMEVTDKLEDNLEKLIGDYKYRLQTPVRDGFSICLLSKHKMENPDISFHGPGKTPLLHAEINLDNTLYHIFSAHPKPALNKNWYHERHVYFHEIVDIIQHTKLPSIVLGDFNSVPWERHFVDFCHKTGLKSTAEGYGYKITWPTYFLPLGIPMDHILLPIGESYKDLTIGPNAGSDHYPIAINL